MLSGLFIKNFAVIEDLKIELSPGVNALTGETGAGKSIVIQAIRFLFGQINANSAMIRRGAEKLEVRALLGVQTLPSDIRKELLELELDLSQDHIALRRVFDLTQNRSRSWIDELSVSSGLVQKLGNSLLEIHEQGSQIQIKDSRFALDYLDLFGELKGHRASYEKAFRELATARLDLENHQKFVAENASKMEFLKFQTEEFAAAKLDPETQIRLERDLPLLMDKEKILQALASMSHCLSDPNADILSRLAAAQREIAKIKEKMESPSPLEKIDRQLAQARDAVEEILAQVRNLRQNLDCDPAALEELLALKARRDRLIGKYKLDSHEELQKLEMKIKDDLNKIENWQVLDQSKERTCQEKRKTSLALARELSLKRKKKAQELTRTLNQEIQGLGLDKAQLEIQIKSDFENLLDAGADQVEMLFAPNPGEGLKALRAIASGGETSRVALALEVILARNKKHLSNTLLVFDEIEQGLSAQAANQVARKIRELGQSHQIILITHSPVLAASSDAHFAVSKETGAGRTKTVIEKLMSPAAKRQEILRLLGASNSSQKKSLEPYVAELLAVSVS